MFPTVCSLKCPAKTGNDHDATADFDMMMFNEYYSTWYNKSIGVISGELDRIIGEYPGQADDNFRMGTL